MIIYGNIASSGSKLFFVCSDFVFVAVGLYWYRKRLYSSLRWITVRKSTGTLGKREKIFTYGKPELKQPLNQKRCCILFNLTFFHRTED